MKIGQLTLLGRGYNNNFGANLQAYALQRILRKSGHDPEIIDFVPSSITWQKRVRDFYHSSRNTLNTRGVYYIIKRFPNWVVERFFRKRKPMPISREDIERARRFEEFRKKYITFTRKTYYSCNQLSECDEMYDSYVVGSDVVWSPKYVDENQLKAYLLAFSQNKPGISYAASVAQEVIPSWMCKYFKKYLPRLRAISVREKTSAVAIEKCTGIKAKVVIDPAALLDQKEWKEISKKPKKLPKDRFVLVYDLLNSDKILPLAKKFANDNNLELVTYSLGAGYSFYSFGPQEFLWLYKNAEFVISSSFHGVVFSILFRKPFLAITPRSFAGQPPKIIDFLKTLELEDRLLDLQNNNVEIIDPKIFEIDWQDVFERINEERSKSLEFLKSALGDG